MRGEPGLLVLLSGVRRTHGGIQRYNMGLIEVLRKRPLATRILIQNDLPGDWSAGDQSSNLEIVACGGRSSWAAKARFMAEILRACSTRRWTGLVVGLTHYLPLLVLPWRGKPRFALIAHGVEAWRLSRWEARLVPRLHLLVAASLYTAERLRARVPRLPELVRVVPGPVRGSSPPDWGEYARLRQAVGVGPEFVILTVSRLSQADRYKNVDKVLMVLAESEGALGPWRYWIVGDGDDRPRLEAIARNLGIIDRVAFLGVLSEEELERRYRAADLFVLPSQGEGFGIVLAEAAAHGLPVICADEGGAVEAVAGGELGLAVSLDFPEGLTRAMALARRLSARWGFEERRARQERALELFGEDRFGARIEEALRLLLGVPESITCRPGGSEEPCGRRAQP